VQDDDESNGSPDPSKLAESTKPDSTNPEPADPEGHEGAQGSAQSSIKCDNTPAELADTSNIGTRSEKGAMPYTKAAAGSGAENKTTAAPAPIMQDKEQSEDAPPPRVASTPFVKGVGGVFVTLGGLAVGIAGIYGNLFPSSLVLTAFLVDMLGVIWLISMVLSWSRRGQPRLTRRDRLYASMSVLTALALMITATWMAFRPPEGRGDSVAQEGACVYDVHAKDTTVPIVTGGSITQDFAASASRINAISVIIGLDSTIANPNHLHPVALRVRSREERVDQTLRADDIVNNGFVRFNFPEPLQIKNQNTSFSMQIINKSPEPVGVNIKIPDKSDTINPPSQGVFIVGHRGQEDGYEKPDYALSGCVEGRP